MLIRRKAEQSEVYVGALGWRYGMVHESSGYTMTELEYRQAVTIKKPIHMFVIHGKAAVAGDMLELDPEYLRKLNEFRALVLKSHVVEFFSNVDHLERKMEQTLRWL